MDAKLQVGAGRADITPQIGAWLMGYAPGRQAQSINDRLNVTAVAFAWAGEQALIASADVCVISEPLMSQTRQAMAEASGIPFDRIILTATHTHSGPAMRQTPGGSPLDEQYLSGLFVPGAARAARQAVEHLQTALVGVAETNSDVGVNRRVINADGSISLGQNPYGSHDPVMTVVSFRAYSGQSIANLIHYGAHNTAAGRSPEITRDWCGVMVDRLESVSGGMTLFLNGCEGDCGPRLPSGGSTGDLQEALELGGRAASDAVRAWRSIRQWRSDCDLRAICGDLPLPLEELPPLADLEQNRLALGDPEQLTGLKVMEYERLCERIELVRAGTQTEPFLNLSETVISVGPIAFVPIPFEVFSIITLRIRQYSPFAHTLCLSNGNGSRYYFPSRDQICRGGYEIWVFKSMNVQPFADHSEQFLVDGCIRLLNGLEPKQA